tara:strand:- start:367 stop:630 length:264 start_codon:yes stop_codon:yes gene_type:complete
MNTEDSEFERIENAAKRRAMQDDDYPEWLCDQSPRVAAELRRLHEANQELLAALKALSDADDMDYISIKIWIQARAAIAKAEGERYE